MSTDGNNAEALTSRGDVAKSQSLQDEAAQSDLSLLSITEGESERGIPMVKFVEDIGAFADTFTPPASAELLIGAYSDLFSKFKQYEQSLGQKSKYDLRFVCRRFPCRVCLLYWILVLRAVQVLVKGYTYWCVRTGVC